MEIGDCCKSTSVGRSEQLPGARRLRGGGPILDPRIVLILAVTYHFLLEIELVLRKDFADIEEQRRAEEQDVECDVPPIQVERQDTVMRVRVSSSCLPG